MEESNEGKAPLCKCGCGRSVRKRRNGTWNQYCVGHNPKQGKSGQTSNSGHSGQFKPGNNFGKGRPMGSRNAVTVAAENLIAGEGEALSRKLVELALDGNVACLKVAIERLVPPVKSKPIHLPDLPKVESIAEASTLTAFILNSVAAGTITPIEAEILSRTAERHLKALEVRDIEKRLAELESKVVGNRSN